MSHKKGHGDPAKSNYGAFKNRAVAHSDRPSNWYRRAPHEKRSD